MLRKRLNRWTLKIGTWNIRGIRIKQSEVVSDIEKMDLDIVLFSEAKKKGQPEKILRNFYYYWSGV